MKNDITNREDIKLLVDHFYEKVQADELIGPIFSRVDWPHHLPIMYNFWSSMMLGDQSYMGNPFEKHLRLPLQPEHFNRWLDLFRGTVREHFQGQKADEIITRAESIAGVFQMRMGLIQPQ